MDYGMLIGFGGLIVAGVIIFITEGRWLNRL